MATRLCITCTHKKKSIFHLRCLRSRNTVVGTGVALTHTLAGSAISRARWTLLNNVYSQLKHVLLNASNLEYSQWRLIFFCYIYFMNSVNKISKSAVLSLCFRRVQLACIVILMQEINAGTFCIMHYCATACQALYELSTWSL